MLFRQQLRRPAPTCRTRRSGLRREGIKQSLGRLAQMVDGVRVDRRMESTSARTGLSGSCRPLRSCAQRSLRVGCANSIPPEFKELEIVVLRHELAILRRQVGALRFDQPTEHSWRLQATANPNGNWVVQQARNFAWSLADRPAPPRFLIHDRDSKVTAAFDEVLRSEGLQIVTTRIRAPRANADAERFDGTRRAGRERSSAARARARGLGLTPPQSKALAPDRATSESGRVRRRDAADVGCSARLDPARSALSNSVAA